MPSFKFDMRIDVSWSASASAFEFSERKLFKLEMVLEVSDVRVGRGGGGTCGGLEEEELAEVDVATELRFEEVLKRPLVIFNNTL